MARVTQFSVGRRWRCQNREGRAPFDFVIIGKGHNDNHKLCILETPEEALEFDRLGYHSKYRYHGLISEYPHSHLKKRALLQDEVTPDVFSFEHEGVCYRFDFQEQDRKWPDVAWGTHAKLLVDGVAVHTTFFNWSDNNGRDLHTLAREWVSKCLGADIPRVTKKDYTYRDRYGR